MFEKLELSNKVPLGNVTVLCFTIPGIKGKSCFFKLFLSFTDVFGERTSVCLHLDTFVSKVLCWTLDSYT